MRITYRPQAPIDLDPSCVFAPVSTLPEEWKATDSGERRLLLALLHDAVTEFAKGMESARRWIFDEPIGGFKFTFDQVCEHLGFDPDASRERLCWYAPEELRSRIKRRACGGTKTRVAA